MHKLIVIGWRGLQDCFLDLPREEAIRRYEAASGQPIGKAPIKEIEFNEEFGAYDVWDTEEEKP